MASVSLRDVLAAPQLCGAFETVKSGIPDVFPKEFYNSDQSVRGYTGSYFQYPGQRQLAQITGYGSPSTATQMKGITEVPIILWHICKNLTIPAHRLMGLISKDSAGSNLLIDEKGVQEVTRHIKNAVELVRNFKIAVLAQMFTLGANYFDASGNLLPTSSGAKTTTNSQITSGNLGNLTTVLSGATAWNNSAAEIEDDLIHLDQLVMDNTGYELSYAFYGRNIPKYFSNNTKLVAFLTRNATGNDMYIKRGRITELGNLSWLPGYRSSFRDQNDATQRIIGDNQIIFTPTPDPSWFGWVHGSYPVPNSVEVEKEGLAALANITEVTGDFMYATVLTDPTAIKIVYGTTSLPTVRVPSACYAVDVTA